MHEQQDELTALLEGLRALRRPSHVTVFTDSEYVAKPSTVGYIRKWQSRGYSKIKNPDLWKAIVRPAAMHRLALLPAMILAHGDEPDGWTQERAGLLVACGLKLGREPHDGEGKVAYARREFKVDLPADCD